MMNTFKLVSDFNPKGDQPQAIRELEIGIKANKRDQTLLGATGTGKTFTMANVIADLDRPAMIISHNKTLAAQLYEEMRAFFPYNAVEYFVSYYDYYQPEAYIPQTDTYIEKDSAINEKIDLLRHSATRSLLERRDVIVVSSVSSIYGLGSPELYLGTSLNLKAGDNIKIKELQDRLVELHYHRNDINFVRGTFRLSGDTLDIFPSHYENRAWRISFFGNDIENIYEFNPLTGQKTSSPLEGITIFANSHYVTPKLTLEQATKKIKQELEDYMVILKQENKLLELQRIEQRTYHDLEMMQATGTCKGIENYSRYLSGRGPGEPPPTLFEYLPKDAILFIDESHVTVPQINGMFNGDQARKKVLVEHGFRLPSAMDNRPMKFSEWDRIRPLTIYVSATPGPYEMGKCNNEYILQVIRPTGILDPPCEVRKIATQVDDLMAEAQKVIGKGLRVLVTTLTKKMSEKLTEYLQEANFKVVYLHSDIDTLTRIEIIHDLRSGRYDILVGVNLLREGLDIPECGLVAILDADKEGFLRSSTALIQTIGRAARNVESFVILYADRITKSMAIALAETERRRQIQSEYNIKHNITPLSIKKSITTSLQQRTKDSSGEVDNGTIIVDLEKAMLAAAENLDFEQAMKLRDKIKKLKKS